MVQARELEMNMEATAGGTSRFGALATVLSGMGERWKMYTPPYILLLIRTFLTLEGIAGQVPCDTPPLPPSLAQCPPCTLASTLCLHQQ